MKERTFCTRSVLSWQIGNRSQARQFKRLLCWKLQATYTQCALLPLAPAKVVSDPCLSSDRKTLTSKSSAISPRLYLLDLRLNLCCTCFSSNLKERSTADSEQGAIIEKQAAAVLVQRLLSWSEECISRRKGSVLIKEVAALYGFYRTN